MEFNIITNKQSHLQIENAFLIEIGHFNLKNECFFFVCVQLKFSCPNNVPMANKLLQLELSDRLVGNYTTDENGEAQFSIDTSDIFDPEFRLKVRYQSGWDPTEEIMLGILKIRSLLKDTLHWKYILIHFNI